MFKRALVLVSVGLISSAVAQVPPFVHQEGVLVDNVGNPIAGPITLDFRFYAAAAAGVAVSRETFANVALTEGYYSVLLGTNTALTPAIVQSAPYMSIAVNNGAELAPRTRLVSVPFAMVAGSVSGGPVSATTVAIGANTVIDANGRWVGNLAGLQGVQGVAGVPTRSGSTEVAGTTRNSGAPGHPQSPAALFRSRSAPRISRSASPLSISKRTVTSPASA